ncbi:MAG: ABC transporter permease subunit [Blastochloris sp.]|jgi:ABC-2 type transport system permease protein|nr:ABC transporter permease subunit [Blastochloris sp.]
MTRAFFVLLKRELAAVVFSPIAYVTFVLLYLVNGFSFQFLLYAVSKNGALQNLTIMQVFFSTFFYWIVIVVSIPILTMRLFSEEYRSGTIELLLTAPVTDWDVVLSKYFSQVLFYIALWLPTLTYVWIFQVLTKNQIPISWGPIALTYAMVLMVGMFYLSIGLFTSVMSRNQVLAAFGSFVIIILLFFSGFLGMGANDSIFQEMISYIGVLGHMSEFSKGVFDTRPVVFYFSFTLLFLFLTQQVMSLRRLKS